MKRIWLAAWWLVPITVGCVATQATSGCSLSTFDRSECSVPADCRESFGFGFTCGSEGYCERLSPIPRCTQTYPADLFSNPAKYPNAIVFGNLMDRSQTRQAAREKAARLAILQANQAASLEGRKFGMVFCTVEENLSFDDLPMDDAAVASARWLAQVLGAPAIVGPAGSSSTAAVYQALVGTGTLIISPSATSATLTELDTTSATDENPGMLWRTAPSDAAQGPTISDDMTKRGISRLAIIHQTDAYGQGLANIVSKTFGGTVELFPFVNDNERSEAVVKVSNTSVDEVLFIASNSGDIVAFLNGAGSTTGYETKSIFLTDAAASRDVFLEASGAKPLFDRIRGTRVRPLGEEFAYKTFLAGYQGEYGEDAKNFSFTAQAYDAAWLVVYGSAWSLYRTGDVHGRGIAQGLRKVSCVSDGATQPCNATPFDVVSSSWMAIAKNFHAGTAIEIRGASGDLDFDLATEETLATIEVWVVDDNSYVVRAP